MAAPASSGELVILRQTNLVQALFTEMRDKTCSRERFVATSNRLVRLIIEESMALLPSKPVTVQTPCGPYEGVRLPEERSICAVSILRGADCMLGEVWAGRLAPSKLSP